MAAEPDAGAVDGVTQSGFDRAPSRPTWLTVVLMIAVMIVAAGFAHGFRETVASAIEWYASGREQLDAANSMRWYVVFVLATAAVFIAAAIGRQVDRHWGRHTGVEAVAASARGEGRSISLRATGARAVATWTAYTGLISIGRESAIIETGGAVGAVVGRSSRGRGDALATAGIAAAFAAAYHAPVAGMLYVEEHLGVSTSRRALIFAITGALGGHAASIWLFGGHEIFPPTQGSRWRMLLLALVVLVPSVLAARLFLQLRVRVKAVPLAERLGVPWWLVVGIFAVVAGLAIATFPDASGNGMEALRYTSVHATIGMGLALAVGKLIGTVASLGSAAPGGVLTPTISITSGAALLTLLAVDRLGLAVVHPWDVMVVAMAVGVAVGLRSPFGAVFLLPEMVGDYTLVPPVALIVALAVVLDRGLDRLVVRAGEEVPTGIYDEDA